MPASTGVHHLSSVQQGLGSLKMFSLSTKMQYQACQSSSGGTLPRNNEYILYIFNFWTIKLLKMLLEICNYIPMPSFFHKNIQEDNNKQHQFSRQICTQQRMSTSVGHQRSTEKYHLVSKTPQSINNTNHVHRVALNVEEVMPQTTAKLSSWKIAKHIASSLVPKDTSKE